MAGRLKLAARRARADLIGRAAEMAQLEAVCRAAAEGRGRAVFVTGEPGVGKSFLNRAFLQAVKRGSPSAVVLSARCPEGIGPLRPYGPFRDLVDRLRGGKIPAALRSRLLRDAPAWMTPGARAASPSHLREQFVALCRALAGDRPTVLSIDDVQWSDPSSLELLGLLGQALSEIPLVLTVTADGESTPPRIAEARKRIGAGLTMDISLVGLEPHEVEALISRRLEGRPAPDLVEWLAKTTRGNPFHVTELLRLLRDRGAVRRRLLKYSLKASSLPGEVGRADAVAAARIAALDPELRWTLEAAAFAGPVILPSVVAGMIEVEEDRALADLKAAERRQGILERAEGSRTAGARGPAFRFRHALFRRVVRMNVTGKRVERLARRAAEELGRRAEAENGDLSDEIAALYGECGDTAGVYDWSLRAADLAERLYGMHELETFLERAAETAPDAASRAVVDVRMAELYLGTGRESQAEELLEGVIAWSRESGDRRMEVRAGTRLGRLQLSRDVDSAGMGGLAAGLVDAARQAEATAELVDALEFAGIVAERLGRAEEALLMAEEAFHLAQGSGDDDALARSAYRLAHVHIGFEDPAAGGELARQALEIYEAGRRSERISECRHLIGRAEFRAGNWDAAWEQWSALLDAPGEETATPRAIVQIEMSELAALRGDFERAHDLAESAIALARELPDVGLELRGAAALARLDLERGDHEAVLERTESIRAALPEHGAWRVDFLTTAIRALAQLELGDELQAWQEAARLEQLYQGKEGWFEGRAEGDAVRIRVIDLDADSGLASMIAEQGIRETADKDPYGEALLQYHRAIVVARTGSAEAHAAAARACELFARLGAVPMLERSEHLSEQLQEREAARVEPVESADGVTDAEIDRWFDGIEG